MSSDYFLRWHDFASRLASSFDALRTNETLLDVSIVAKKKDSDDTMCLRAHKTVLAACSPVFASMFSSPSCDSVFMRGVGAEHLRSLLDFVYRGEVAVAQNQLDDFLRLANDLGIRGLENDGDHEEHVEQDEDEVLVLEDDTSPPLSQQGSVGSNSHQDRDSHRRRSALQGLMGQGRQNEVLGSQLMAEHSGANEQQGFGARLIPEQGLGPNSVSQVFNPNGTLTQPSRGPIPMSPSTAAPSSSLALGTNEDRYSGILRLENGCGRCVWCNKEYSSYGAAKRHYELKHQPPERLKCYLCTKVFTKDFYRTIHLRRVHKVRRRRLAEGVSVFESLDSPQALRQPEVKN